MHAWGAHADSPAAHVQQQAVDVVPLVVARGRVLARATAQRQPLRQPARVTRQILAAGSKQRWQRQQQQQRCSCWLRCFVRLHGVAPRVRMQLCCPACCACSTTRQAHRQAAALGHPEAGRLDQHAAKHMRQAGGDHQRRHAGKGAATKREPLRALQRSSSTSHAAGLFDEKEANAGACVCGASASPPS